MNLQVFWPEVLIVINLMFSSLYLNYIVSFLQAWAEERICYESNIFKNNIWNFFWVRISSNENCSLRFFWYQTTNKTWFCIFFLKSIFLFLNYITYFPLLLKIFISDLKYVGESFKEKLLKNVVSGDILVDKEGKKEESNIKKN